MSALSLRVLLCCAVVGALLAPGAAARPDMRTTGAAGACASAERTLAAHSSVSALKTFDDFIEDTLGPDICGENALTNDNEGTITFGMHIHNRQAFVAGEHYGVFLDTDNNPATGVEGADYLVQVAGDGVELGKWDGTAFAKQATLAPAMWAPGYGPVFQLKAADLGDVKSFGFFFYSTDDANVDYAPDRGAWSYQLTPLQLALGKPTLDRARAGRTFSARMTVVRSDLDIALTEGAIACSAKVGARVLTGSGRFAGNRVACTWRLPKNSRGKQLSGSLAVVFQGVAAKRSFVTTVR
jgi:hypothetical protein